MPSKQRWALVWALCAVAHHGGAWAINQCVGPDGKVSFQDAPCAPDQTSKEIKVHHGLPWKAALIFKKKYSESRYP